MQRQQAHLDRRLDANEMHGLSLNRFSDCSASLQAFLLPLKKGFIYCAGISELHDQALRAFG
ncbi:MAG: hypothetical protein ACR2RE_04605 [Geminicoccaceae bacterium]